jgi:hypothetical protein
MAAKAAILDLVCVDYLTSACRLAQFFGASLGVINLHHVPLLPKPYRPCTHRQCPNQGHMPCLALPLFFVCGLTMGWSSSLSKMSRVRFSHSPTSSFQFLYSPYPSPGAQSPSKCFTAGAHCRLGVLALTGSACLI